MVAYEEGLLDAPPRCVQRLVAARDPPGAHRAARRRWRRAERRGRLKSPDSRGMPMTPSRQHRGDRHPDARGRQPRPPALQQADRLARRRGHRRHRRGRHHRRVADRRLRRAQASSSASRSSTPRAASRSSPAPAATRPPRRSSSPIGQEGRRRPPACRWCRTTTSRPRKACTAISAPSPSGRPADDPVQRARPHRGRSAERHRAAAGAGAEHHRHQGRDRRTSSAAPT